MSTKSSLGQAMSYITPRRHRRADRRHALAGLSRPERPGVPCVRPAGAGRRPGNRGWRPAGLQGRYSAVDPVARRIEAAAGGNQARRSLNQVREARWRGTMVHLERITMDPEVCGGRPCIRGMLVWVSVNPELRIDTTGLSPMEAAQEIYLYLLREGYLDSETSFE